MQRFNNILLVLNPEANDSATLDKAISLARQNGANLTLFSVLKEPPGLQGYGDVIAHKQQESAVTERKEWLRGLMASRPANDVKVLINAVEGIAFLEIIRQVLREQHNLVIITAEEKKGIRVRLFGTTSMHLMRKCPCPVWVVKRSQTKPYTRILAAVDPTIHDPERDSLNPMILQVAVSMAHNEKAELHIIHVWHLFAERYLSNRGLTINKLKEAKDCQKKYCKQWLDTLLYQANFTKLKSHLHLIEGEPDEQIPELVMAQGIDLLIMGSVCRTGIAGFLIGNTAEEVLNQVDCSVLTIKPQGFVTPVTLD